MVSKITREIFKHPTLPNAHILKLSNTKNPKEIIFDSEDLNIMSSYNWLGAGSTISATVSKNGYNERYSLGRLLMCIDDDEPRLVAHLNKNVLDFRKHNLILAVRGKHKIVSSSRKSSSNESGYKNIYKSNIKGYIFWIATISFMSDNKRVLRTKSFSIKKYGNDKALQLAIAAEKELRKKFFKL